MIVAVVQYAVFVYSRAKTGGLPAGGLWTTATSNCHSYRRAYQYWYAQEIIPYYRYFVPVQPRGVGQILMT